MEISVSLLPYLEKKDSPTFDAFLYIEETLILKAHRNILSLAIPFFERTFQSGMKEAETGEVTFPEEKISADVLKALVRCVYGEKLKVDSANVYDIHDAANFLEMGEVSVKCATFMASNLKVDTVIATWEYAHRDFDGSKNLRKRCEEFIENRFLDVYRREEFLKKRVDVICQFLSSEQIGVSSENDVVDALLLWLNHDWKNRFHLVSERSLLDLVFWESVDSSVRKLGSLKVLQDRDCKDAAEEKAFTMILKKVSGLPDVASEPLRRAKAESLGSDSTEFGSVYVVQTGQADTRPLVIYDVAMDHVRGPLTLNMPEGINHVLGMILHQSRPFLIASTDINFTPGHQLLLLELRNGRLESKIDLILPPDVQNGRYEMAAAPTNSDKVCIALRGLTDLKLLLVYDLSMQCLEPPKSEGSRGSLRCAHCIADVPKTAVRERGDSKIVYTPGKIWVFQTKVINYDLNLKSWSKPLGIDYGLKAGKNWTMSTALVAFDYIIIAFICDKECQIRMFNYSNGSNGGSIYSLKCSLSTWSSVSRVSLATVGQLLLVYISDYDGYEVKAFSVKLDIDGKPRKLWRVGPSEQLSRHVSMDQFKPDFMLQII